MRIHFSRSLISLLRSASVSELPGGCGARIWPKNLRWLPGTLGRARSVGRKSKSGAPGRNNAFRVLETLSALLVMVADGSMHR